MYNWKRITGIFVIGTLLLSCAKENQTPEETDKPEESAVISRSPVSKSAHIEVKYEVEGKVNKIASLLPVPTTNEYQEIKSIKINHGNTYSISGTANKYSEYIILNPQPGEISHSEEIELKTYRISTDFDKIKEIYEYDKNSDIYKSYLGKSGDVVDPTNAKIKEVGDRLWERSKDILDYARNAYQYVADSYKYLNPNTGIHPLQTILNNGGGDCGNLSSIYISLLRYKNIPSRHVVAVRTDGTFHVWADFYLEKYGWIPVDVTFKNGDPRGDYFGTCPGDAIVVSFDVCYELSVEGNLFNCDLFQNYLYWYWSGSNSAKVKTSYMVSGN